MDKEISNITEGWALPFTRFIIVNYKTLVKHGARWNNLLSAKAELAEIRRKDKDAVIFTVFSSKR